MPPTEAAKEAAREYLRPIGCMDNCRVGPRDIEELAQALDAFASAAVEAERKRIVDLITDWRDSKSPSELGDFSAAYAVRQIIDRLTTEQTR